MRGRKREGEKNEEKITVCYMYISTPHEEYNHDAPQTYTQIKNKLKNINLLYYDFLPNIWAVISLILYTGKWAHRI